MDINVNVTISAPGLENAIAALATLHAGIIPQAAAVEAPVAESKKNRGYHKNDKDKAAQASSTEKATAEAKENTAATDDTDKAESTVKLEPTVEKAPEPEKETEAPKITLSDVRTKLAELSHEGKQKQVKELITSFGAKKLTDIPEDKYPELMGKAAEIE